MSPRGSVRGRFWGWLLLGHLVCLSCGGGSERVSTKERALRPKEVMVAEVTRRDFNRRLDSTGSLIPRNQATLRVLVDGPVEQVLVDIGDRIKKGQVLCQTRKLEARLSVEAAEAALQTARSNLNALQAWTRSEEVALLRAEVARAASEYERLEKERQRSASLLERGAISRSEWDQARTAGEAAEAGLKVAQERLAIAETGPTPEAVEVARSQVAERKAALAQARRILEDTSVRAPFDGVITAKLLREGDYAKRGDPALEISDLRILEAEMQAPERYAELIQVGIPVQLEIHSIAARRSGKVVAVNSAIDLSTRTFLIKVEVGNPDQSIKAGAFCTGVFELPTVQQVLAVPLGALREERGRKLVWVAENEQARRVIVTTGERDDQFVEITQGLNGTETVIVEGAGTVLEGDVLSPTPR